MIIQESPDQKKKRDLAEQMIIQGQSSQPIRSPLQGIANLAKAISGKYQLDKADQSLDTRKADAKQALADALSETDANKRISILSANEDTSPYATQLMLSDLKGGQEIERAKELEKWKMDNTPTEQWTEIKDEKGNVIAQKSSVTGKVVADPRYRESKLLTDEELAQQQKLKAAGKTDITNTVNQGGEAVQIDKIPKDHMLIKDGDNYRMEVIEGSPTDIERKELAKKKEGAEESQIDTANLVQEELGRAKDKIMKNPKLTTGFFGEQLKNWGGSDAADVKALLDTIGANIGFDYLNSMRQNSPTGS
jgi:hypothetical protein